MTSGSTLLIQETTSVTLKKRGGTNHYQQTASPESNSDQPYDGYVMGTKWQWHATLPFAKATEIST